MSTPIPSPCADVCRLDGATGFCIGCLRTREEIKGWKTMSDELRVQVIAQRAPREAAARAQVHGPRPQGVAAHAARATHSVQADCAANA